MFLQTLEKQVLLCDGSTGVELQNRGLATGESPESLLLKDPDMVLGLHRDYLSAGADIIETDTFGANRARLAHYGMEHQVRELIVRAVDLARRAAAEVDRRIFVAGSIGPTGEILQPIGSLSEDQAYAYFAEAVTAFEEAGADVLFIETMMAIEEARIAVRAARENSRLPIVAAMTFEKGKAGLRTPWGVDIPTAVQTLPAAGADVLGANCGKGFDEMVDIISEMRPLTRLPLLAQPNAGLPQWQDGRNVYSDTPESIEPYARKLLQLGVNIIGGCCGTGPSHIRKMRQLVDQFNEG